MNDGAIKNINCKRGDERCNVSGMGSPFTIFLHSCMLCPFLLSCTGKDATIESMDTKRRGIIVRSTGIWMNVAIQDEKECKQEGARHSGRVPSKFLSECRDSLIRPIFFFF